MTIAITDANIFIDLHYLDLLDSLFLIDLDIHTTHEVIDELDDDQVEYLTNKQREGKLSVYVLEASDYEDISNMELPNGLSPTDKSICHYAQKLDSIVITGDMKLRKTLDVRGKRVHGIVWLFDQWVEKEVLEPLIAADSLKNLVEFNTWLPMEECVQRIDYWSNLN